MKQFERRVFSQAGQDGIIEFLFDKIGYTIRKYFVEFGTVDGLHISNTANLRLNHGWTGVLMDANPTANLVRKEFVTAENIQQLLHRHRVPFDLDFLSIDIDGNDYWVWRAIKKWWPRVVSIEFNSNFAWNQAVVMPYDPTHVWDGTCYYGASLAALDRLGGMKGYSLVHVVGNLDAFFVRNDCMKDMIRRSPQDLLPLPIVCHAPAGDREWQKVI
jgi:hypothetical protein